MLVKTSEGTLYVKNMKGLLCYLILLWDCNTHSHKIFLLQKRVLERFVMLIADFIVSRYFYDGHIQFIFLVCRF